jgi:hypothetical protein
VLKKTIKFNDLDGNEVEEVHYFHLNKAELVEMEMSHKGGLSETLQRIVAAEDGQGIIREFKSIILGAYGKRSEDGRRFVKNQQIRDEFESSEAYSALFMELITNTDSAIEFVNGVIPQGMAEEAAKLAEVPVVAPQEEGVIQVVPKAEPRRITKAELDETPREDMLELVRQIARGEVIVDG